MPNGPLGKLTLCQLSHSRPGGQPSSRAASMRSRHDGSNEEAEERRRRHVRAPVCLAMPMCTGDDTAPSPFVDVSEGDLGHTIGCQPACPSVERPMTGRGASTYGPLHGRPKRSPQQERDRPMSTGKDYTAITEDELDTEAHSLTRNDNETIVDDKSDVEGHRLAASDNEVIVEGMRRFDPQDDNELAGLGAPTIRAR